MYINKITILVIYNCSTWWTGEHYFCRYWSQLFIMVTVGSSLISSFLYAHSFSVSDRRFSFSLSLLLCLFQSAEWTFLSVVNSVSKHSSEPDCAVPPLLPEKTEIEQRYDRHYRRRNRVVIEQ